MPIDPFFRLVGSPNAIPDITTAVEREILVCLRTQTQHNLRLVCQDTSAGRDALYADTGAEGKLVRLPNSVRNRTLLNSSCSHITDYA